MEAGTITATGTGTITFTTTFTVPPIVLLTVVSGNSTATSVTLGTVTQYAAPFSVWTGTSASTTSRTIHWTAIQMTSTTAAG